MSLVETEARAVNDTASLEKIRVARQERTATEQLRIAAEALPRTLRPGDVNPLQALYGVQSQGIHSLSDEECLEIAERLRFTLGDVIENLHEVRDRAERFRSDVQASVGGRLLSPETESG